ncbi:IS1182 family transposase [Aurantimonas sp. A3-2-R12]|uniref:IS1182 family transposase n=1 Tax=Aurantimonas sp. A3-2-R12 TaxID=3114362 RepID=UPI002E18B37B|nr:IS1182 family transposase [Aurantimonas sp. A3-2-R12]
MMGSRQVDQASLFYEFSLERHVPGSHLLRSIDRFVDLSGLRRELSPFYSTTGRPSVDPELMLRMLIVGYCFGIRSERRLCDEVHLNLAYRWFCRLGLNGDVPDHSTFSKNRHGRFRDSDLLRRLFETVLGRCIEEGLVGGEGFAVDGSLIKADASRQKGVEASDWSTGMKPRRAVEEYLAVLDDAAFGAATPVEPKFVSLVDPAARWTGADGGLAYFAYETNYLIDLDHAIIVDVEPTTAIRQAEVAAAKRMIEGTRERFDLYPARLAADTGYGSAGMLGWLVYDQGIEPHVSVFDKSARRDGTFERGAFTYDREGDVYFCPAGKMLTTKGTLVNDGATLLYRASKFDCEACDLKERCTPREPARKVPRSIFEGARDMARDIMNSEEGRASKRQRKKVEMLFAHLKRILKLDRLRLRGPCGARDEFHLAATAQNLRKMAKLIPMPEPKPT